MGDSLPTRESLGELGAAVKESLQERHRSNVGSDLEAGFNSFNVSLDNVMQLLENPFFENKCMLALGKTEWADQKWSAQSTALVMSAWAD